MWHFCSMSASQSYLPGSMEAYLVQAYTIRNNFRPKKQQRRTGGNRFVALCIPIDLIRVRTVDYTLQERYDVEYISLSVYSELIRLCTCTADLSHLVSRGLDTARLTLSISAYTAWPVSLFRISSVIRETHVPREP
jgi:hypothetical protein